MCKNKEEDNADGTRRHQNERKQQAMMWEELPYGRPVFQWSSLKRNMPEYTERNRMIFKTFCV